MNKIILKLFAILSICSISLFAEYPLYASCLNNGNWEIFKIDIEKKSSVQITNTLYDEKDLSISTSRKKLIYTCSDGYIRILNLADKIVTDSFIIDSLRTLVSQPAFYINNTILVSHLIDAENDRACISLVDRKNHKPLIEMFGSLFFPTPLNDGSIIYSYLLCSNACKSFITELWLYDINTEMNTQLTKLGAYIIDPDILNDDTIIFSANVNNQRDIYSYSMVTNETYKIIATEGEDVQPKVSPDNTTIAFIKRYQGSSNLQIYNIKKKYINTIPVEQTNILSIEW